MKTFLQFTEDLAKRKQYENERIRRKRLTQPQSEADPTIHKLSRLLNRELRR